MLVFSSNLGHCLFHKYLLSDYNMPGTEILILQVFILGTKDLSLSQSEKNPMPHKAKVLVGEGKVGRAK